MANPRVPSGKTVHCKHCKHCRPSLAGWTRCTPSIAWSAATKSSGAIQNRWRGWARVFQTRPTWRTLNPVRYISGWSTSSACSSANCSALAACPPQRVRVLREFEDFLGRHRFRSGISHEMNVDFGGSSSQSYGTVAPCPWQRDR